MDIKIIGRTIEKDPNNDELFNPNIINEDMKIFAGKAAGICYAPDNYFEVGIQNKENALKRANRNCKSGHTSVFEHSMINFIITCPKIVAMILNSTRLYSTSEKSARYTKMKLDTEIERDLYGTWMSRFTKLINEKYGDKFTEKEVEKLAMENARYMTSVYTETTMMYSISFGRAIILTNWLEEFSDRLDIYCDLPFTPDSNKKLLYAKLSQDLRKVAKEIKDLIGESEASFNDSRTTGIDLFRDINTIGYNKAFTDIELEGSSNTLNIFEIDDIENDIDYNFGKDYYGNMYESRYKASFAEFAQAERHRTIHYSVFITDEFYIPELIKGTVLESEWVNDCILLKNNSIIPQAQLLNIIENGRCEDFVTKAKERICMRSQLEISKITKYQASMFIKNYGSLSESARFALYTISSKDSVIMSMYNNDGDIPLRCKFPGYTCKEPCKMCNIGIDNRVI